MFFAFAAGMLIMRLFVEVPGLSAALIILSLLGVGYGIAHILTRAVIERRRG